MSIVTRMKHMRRCCSSILTFGPGCVWQTPLTTTLCCRCPHTAVRSAPPCSVWTQAIFWRRILPRGAPRCSSAPRWPRQATIKISAACRTPGLWHCAARLTPAIWGCGVHIMSAPATRTGRTALRRCPTCWRSWRVRGAGIIWRFSPATAICSRCGRISQPAIPICRSSVRRAPWTKYSVRRFWNASASGTRRRCWALPCWAAYSVRAWT